MCIEKNIKILIIPYWEANSDKLLSEFILSQLKIFGINPNSQINWNDFKDYSSLLKASQKIIKNKQGKLINYKHDGKRIKLTIECQLGHQWETSTYCIIKQNRWCQKCINKKYNYASIMKTYQDNKNIRQTAKIEKCPEYAVRYIVRKQKSIYKSIS